MCAHHHLCVCVKIKESVRLNAMLARIKQGVCECAIVCAEWYRESVRVRASASGYGPTCVTSICKHDFALFSNAST